MLRLITLFSAIGFTTSAFALPAAIASPQRIGTAEFSLVGIPIYSASLYTENGAAFAPSSPFILELTYKRSVSKDKLIEASASEMNRIYGGTGGLEAQLSNCFRDVGKGDRFAAVNRSSDQVDLYFNDQKTCSLKGPSASERFMGIWLSNNSRAPNLSRALRGGK